MIFEWAAEFSPQPIFKNLNKIINYLYVRHNGDNIEFASWDGAVDILLDNLLLIEE